MSSLRAPSPFLLLLLLAMAMCAVYVTTSIGLVGDLIPPLDDTFIHFQYARRLAEGHPFSYQPGEPFSSGATSLLWPAILGFGWRIGFTDTSLYVWALGVGTVLLAVTANTTRTWLSRVADPRTGWLGALLMMVCGPLLWATFSGMEVILFCAAIAGVFEGLTRPGRPAGAPAPGALTWAAVLATIRPEGALLAGVLAVSQVLEAWLDGRSWKAVRPALLWFLPVALGGIQPLLNLANTGMIASSSAVAKRNPRFNRPEDASVAAFVMENLIARGFGGEWFGWLAPFAMGFFGIGAGTLVLRDRAAGRPGLGTLALVWWLLPLPLLALFLPLDWHHYRYIMPYLAIFLPLAALGADRVDHAIALLRGLDAGRPVARAPIVLGVFLALTAVEGGQWPDVLGRNARDIAQQQVALGRWLAANIPADATIAANDVGALAYLGQRRLYDLEGIVTPTALPDALAGEGSVYEEILRVRPNLLVVFPGWFTSSFNSGAFAIRSHTRLGERTISGGPDMVVATIDDAITSTQDQPPTLEPGERVVDTLDISDLPDEAAHHWSSDDAPLAAGRANTVIDAKYADGTRVVDSARRLTGGARFTIERRGATALVGRFGPSEAVSRLRVWVDGADAGEWVIRGVPGETWADQRFSLPQGAGVARIEIEPITVAAGPRGGWHLARLWAVQ